MLGCPQTRKNSYIKIKDIIKIPTTFSSKSLLNIRTYIVRAIPFKNGEEGGGRIFANFRDPPIQKNGIFETPLYNKMAFLRPPYTKNGIFGTPLYNKMPFS